MNCRLQDKKIKQGENMRKIIVLLVVAAMAFSLAACGPNYTEEFNAAVEAYNTKVDEYDTATTDFAEEYEAAETDEEVKALCGDMVVLAEEMLVDSQGYLEEIEGYEEGISDEETFKTTVENIKDTITVVEKDIVDIPIMEEFFVLSYQFSELASEWEAKATEASQVFEDATTVEELNEGLDVIIAIDDEYVEKMDEVLTKIKALELDAYEDDVEDVIEAINQSIDAINEVSEQMEALKQ